MKNFEIPFNDVCEYIISNIKSKNYIVENLTFENNETGEINSNILSCIIGGFVNLDNEKNRGTDGNPMNWKKIILNNKNSFYLVITKYNHDINDEGHYLLYNDDSEFNPMKLTYLGPIIPKNNPFDTSTSLLNILNIPIKNDN